MAWGIVATMSALVLGLLVASAKESFDDMENENIDAGAKIIALHHILVRYGPQADVVRDELRRSVEATLKSDWQEDDLSGDDTETVQMKNGLEAVKDRLNELTPKTDAQRARLAEAEQICGDLTPSSLAVHRTNPDIVASGLADRPHFLAWSAFHGHCHVRASK